MRRISPSCQICCWASKAAVTLNYLPPSGTTLTSGLFATIGGSVNVAFVTGRARPQTIFQSPPAHDGRGPQSGFTPTKRWPGPLRGFAISCSGELVTPMSTEREKLVRDINGLKGSVRLGWLAPRRGRDQPYTRALVPLMPAERAVRRSSCGCLGQASLTKCESNTRGECGEKQCP